MRILALDPGNTQTGVIFYDPDWPDKPVQLAEVMQNDDLVTRLPEWSATGALLAVEMIASYGMPVGREVFETCVWIGRFIQQWKGNHRLIFRRDVKLHLCGSVRAKDPHVWQALVDKFGPPGRKNNPGKLYGVKSHARAALAVAVAAAETEEPK